MYHTTIPYRVEGHDGAGRVMLRSASKGTGVIAGGAVRSIMEAAGIRDVLAKSLGSSTTLAVANATMDALLQLRSPATIARLRGMSVARMVGVTNASS